MRLVNTLSQKLESFADNKIPPYAILSHRWENEEVLFDDMRGDFSRKQGYGKLKGACDQAARDGLRYIWIDTCCIDKTSSTELSEAINSMYTWYKHSNMCYAYLSDVVLPPGDYDPEKMSIALTEDFGRSQWHFRSWTLQELIAPFEVRFLDREWKLIGTKSTFRFQLSQCTGIHPDILLDSTSKHDFILADISIAQRMCWAVGRAASRVEDIAYSLLGIFDVNLPLVYGEGSKAFIRLQEEIIKHSDDQSIFAWENGTEYSALLAHSPEQFKYCREVNKYRPLIRAIPFSMTNMGLKIRLPVVVWGMNTYLALLACTDNQNGGMNIAIYLKPGEAAGQYLRTQFEGLSRVSITEHEFYNLQENNALNSCMRDTKLLLRHHSMEPFRSGRHLYGFHLAESTWWDYGHGKWNHMVVRGRTWVARDRILLMPIGSAGCAGILLFALILEGGLTYILVKLGFDWEFDPVSVVSYWTHADATQLSLDVIANSAWTNAEPSTWLASGLPTETVNCSDSHATHIEKEPIQGDRKQDLVLRATTSATEASVSWPRLGLRFNLLFGRTGDRGDWPVYEEQPDHFGWSFTIEEAGRMSTQRCHDHD